MREEILEKILTFFQALDRVSPGNAPDMGMIVVKPKINQKEIIKMAPAKSNYLILNKESYPDDFLLGIKKSFREKKWIFIELKDGYLPGRIYNQLRNLSVSGRMQIFNLADENEIEITQPKESRIILIATQKIIDSIKAPTFLNLFGPIIYL